MDAAQSSLQEVDSSMRPEPQVERRMMPHKEKALNCPRCTSTNTKFCYYNNYSLSQPRHFCKTCKRYWTEGGSLRNVPVGGGSRKKHKRTSSSTTKLVPSASSSWLRVQPGPEFKMTPSNKTATCSHLSSVVSSYESTISALDLLRSEISGRMMNPFAASVPMPSEAAAYGNGLGLQELTRFSNLKLPLDEVGGGGYGGNMQTVEGAGGCGLQFPFKDLNQVPVSNDSGVVMENGTESSFLWNDVMGSSARGGGRGSL